MSVEFETRKGNATVLRAGKMISDKDNVIVQMVWGAIMTLLAIVIAVNIVTLSMWINQQMVNALMFAFVAVFLLKDGLPNFILGIKEYIGDKK